MNITVENSAWFIKNIFLEAYMMSMGTQIMSTFFLSIINQINRRGIVTLDNFPGA